MLTANTYTAYIHINGNKTLPSTSPSVRKPWQSHLFAPWIISSQQQQHKTLHSVPAKRPCDYKHRQVNTVTTQRTTPIGPQPSDWQVGRLTVGFLPREPQLQWHSWPGNKEQLGFQTLNQNRKQRAGGWGGSGRVILGRTWPDGCQVESHDELHRLLTTQTSAVGLDWI